MLQKESQQMEMTCECWSQCVSLSGCVSVTQDQLYYHLLGFARNLLFNLVMGTSFVLLYLSHMICSNIYEAYSTFLNDPQPTVGAGQ